MDHGEKTKNVMAVSWKCLQDIQNETVTEYVSLKPASFISSLLWLAVSHTPDPGQPTKKKQSRNQCVIYALRHWFSKYVTWCYSVMSQSHRIEGGTTDEAFQEQCFLWEKGDSFVASQYIYLDIYFQKDLILNQLQQNSCISNIIPIIYCIQQGVT